MTKIYFNAIKYITERKESGIDDGIIVHGLETWALESHGKLIEIDPYGNHWVNGTDYLSHEDWEDKIDF